MTWTEGPVWLPDHDAVIFSEIPSNRIMRWDARSGLTLHRTDVEFTNGRTLDRDGTIIACSHGRRAVEGSTRTAAPRSSSIGTGRTG